MNKKLAVIVISMVIASLGVGTSYAIDTLDTDEYAEYWYDPEFTLVSVSDNEGVLDVAVVQAFITSTETIDVNIFNAYPGYEAYIDFTITNTGDPVYVAGLDFDGYDASALSLVVTGIVPGTLLGSEESVSGTLTVSILDGALENTVYLFDVYIDFGDSPP
ncbi:hypothetical protein DRJ16_06890 [Candidatus Woesearchaeota archaeon]|nr:MAG: hypothetical protein DRJ16_06890 [Candidatus Woesearchaeota archaeon]